MKISTYLTDKRFCGNYPSSYNLYYERISKKSRIGQILKKKRFESQQSKVFSKWSVFWDIVNDFKPECCFICGYYIRPEQRIEPNVKRPYKHGDICHVECYNKNIKLEDVTQKINPKSTLICHISKPKNRYDLVCRDRVFNDDLSILKHLQSHNVTELEIQDADPDNIKSFLKQLRNDWKLFRDKNFLKPTGEPFRK